MLSGSRIIAWDKLPGSFRRDAEDYLTWCCVPDPLDEDARAQALAPPTLKLRRKLGTVQRGMTEKNKALLRKFEDPQVLDRLIRLPDTLWRIARSDKSPSKRWFVLLQNAIAIDILLHSRAVE